ncbi:MAG: glycosyltransferase [Myxococcales bacterium]|nr:glycosyltransferase [Myxococcales bacterium]
MRVLVAAFGTRGDVQPAMVAARALQAAGHTCELFVPPSSAEWVRSLGLSATAIGIDYAAVSKAASEGRLIDLLRVLPLLRHEVDAQVEAMGEVVKRCDLVLGCSVFAAGRLLAELGGVPYRFLALSPFMIPSPEHPAPFIRSQTLPGWVNRLTWRLNEVMWSSFLKGPLNRRRRAAGLGPTAAVWSTLLADVTYLAAEPALFPSPTQLAPTRELQQLGALFLDEPNAALSPKLDAFLRAGPPPLFIGFGSMSDRNPAKTTAAIVEGARLAGRRVVVSRGWAGFELPDDEHVCVVGDEPHHLVFPRCAGVVHHGGVGTTHAAARAGVPQAVMPHLLDQFYTAHRLALAGVGFGVPRYQLSGARFAELFTQLSQSQLVERAQQLAPSVILDAPQRLVESLTKASG